MFGWWSRIKTWRSSRARGLYRYFNGRRWLHGDPIALFRAIKHHPKLNLETMAPDIDANVEPETTIFFDAVCEVFSCTRLDPRTGRGLTDAELCGVLDGLTELMEGLKKNSSPGPISSPPADSESSQFQEPPNSTMPPSADYGAMTAGSADGEPTPITRP